jgi:glucosamine-6-phosphate deaminase
LDIKILENPQELGKEAAQLAAKAINEAIARQGMARIVLSTGSSQFETIEALAAMDIDWRRVEMFHLDEYVGLSDRHPASFRKYLKESMGKAIM